MRVCPVCDHSLDQYEDDEIKELQERLRIIRRALASVCLERANLRRDLHNTTRQLAAARCLLAIVDDVPKRLAAVVGMMKDTQQVRVPF